jgi:hypothetical protein
MPKLFVLASLAAAAAAQSINYWPCTSTDCSNLNGTSCEVVPNLPLTNACTADANSGYYFTAVVGSNASVVTVTTFTDAACANVLNINTNLPLTGVANCQYAVCVWRPR